MIRDWAVNRRLTFMICPSEFLKVPDFDTWQDFDLGMPKSYLLKLNSLLVKAVSGSIYFFL